MGEGSVRVSGAKNNIVIPALNCIYPKWAGEMYFSQKETIYVEEEISLKYSEMRTIYSLLPSNMSSRTQIYLKVKD